MNFPYYTCVPAALTASSLTTTTHYNNVNITTSHCGHLEWGVPCRCCCSSNTIMLPFCLQCSLSYYNITESLPLRAKGFHLTADLKAARPYCCLLEGIGEVVGSVCSTSIQMAALKHAALVISSEVGPSSPLLLLHCHGYWGQDHLKAAKHYCCLYGGRVSHLTLLLAI